MTESEWFACKHPGPMLDFVRKRASDRQLRLFACACCRPVWGLIPDGACRDAVEVSLRFADGVATPDELLAARATALAVATASESDTAAWAACETTQLSAIKAARAAAQEARETIERRNPASLRLAEREQAEIIRDIIGNPFRNIHPSLLWECAADPLVREMAEEVYAGGALQETMAALAIRLQILGCPSEVIAHCHSTDPHHHGCWVIDLIREATRHRKFHSVLSTYPAPPVEPEIPARPSSAASSSWLECPLAAYRPESGVETPDGTCPIVPNEHEAEEEPCGVEWGWIAHGAFVGSSIVVLDNSLLHGLLWALLSLVMAKFVAPWLFRCAQRLRDSNPSIWVGVAAGWGLFAGPPAWSAVLAFAPLFGLPLSALHGALLGLLLGPVGGAFNGLLIVGVVEGCMRIVLGWRICVVYLRCGFRGVAMNGVGRDLGAWPRWWLRADPRPVLLLALLLMLAYCWEYRSPQVAMVALNYLGEICFLPVLFGGLVFLRFTQLLISGAFEIRLGVRPNPYRSNRRFLPGLLLLTAATAILVWTGLPMSLAFRVSRPGLDALADEALADPANAQNLVGRRAGCFSVAGVEVINRTVVLYLDHADGVYGFARVPGATSDRISNVDNGNPTNNPDHHQDFPAREYPRDRVGERIAGDWFVVFSAYWRIKDGPS